MMSFIWPRSQMARLCLQKEFYGARQNSRNS